MPQQATSAPDFSDVDQFVQQTQGSKSGSFDDIDSFVAQQGKGAPVAKSPAVQEFEDAVAKQAASSVPSPVVPRGLRPTPALPPYDWQRAIVGGLGDIVGGGTAMPTKEFNAPPVGEEAAQGVRELETPGKRVTGALRTGDAALQGILPVVGPGALEAGEAVEAAPTMTRAVLQAAKPAVAMGAGAGASAATGKIAPKLGATPEQVELAKDLAFWAPGVAASLLNPKFGAAVSPKEFVVRGGISPPGMGDIAAEVRIPRGGGPTPAAGNFEDPTIPNAPNAWEAAKGNLNPRPTLPQATDDPIAQASAALSAKTESEANAARTVQGVPPPAPPVPPAPPQPPPIHEVTPEMAASLAQTIQKLPPELRAQAVIEMHEKMVDVLLRQGKVVGPDGRLHIVDSEKAASKIAQGFINDQVDAADKAAEEKAKATPEKKPEPKPAPNPNENPIVQARALPREPDFSDVHDFVKENTSEAEPAPAKEEAAATQPGSVSAGPGRSELPQTESESATRRTGRDAFTKGDRVQLEDGRKATVIYTSPSDPFVRLQLDQGGKISKGISKLSKLGVESGNEVRGVSPAEQTGGRLVQPTVGVLSERNAGRTSTAGGSLHGQIGNASEVRTPEANPRREPEHTGKAGATAATAGVAAGSVPVRESTEGDERGDRIAITDRNGNEEVVKLEGKKVGQPTPESRAASDAAFQKNYPTETAKELSPVEKELWQQHVFGQKPAEDLGKKVRAANPEPTRAEVKAAAEAEQKKSLAPAPTEAESGRHRLGLPPERGKVGEMRVRDLTVAPHKFQYKLSTDAEGVGTLLKETKVFNPDLAGVISVWRDPDDGKTYVVNGHHRYELAKRTKQDSVTVRHIVAKDAVTARAIGALQNIAEGRGTAIDAAKFFHDSGLTPEQLKEKGISLGEKTAADGMAMSRLDPKILAKVIQGDLRQGMAVAIGEGTADHAQQAAILKQVDRMERKGQKVSDDRVREFIRLANATETRTEETTDLFGTQQVERSLLWEKSEVSEYIQQQLKKDKKLFGFVAKEGRATELARAGNKIDVEKSKELSTGAAQAEEVYNRLSERGGPIASILDEAARKLADGESAGEVKSDAYARIRSEISKTLGGPTGAGAERSEGTPAVSPDNGSILFSPASELAPPFYSKAARIAFDKLPTAGSGQSFLATLRNAGVKEDEIKWIGLDDFLKDKPKATKLETLRYIMNNMVQVREVEHGGKGEPVFRKGFPTREALFTEVMRDDMLWNERQGGLKPGLSAWVMPDGTWNLRDTKETSTKYASYTLPGEKRNYTELLLTLPRPPRKVMDTIAKEMGFGGWTNALTEEQKDKVISAFDRQPGAREPFQSSHFDEPNILAHVRYDERTDADGNKILFVEEVQSDWHQKGKKYGYAESDLQGRIDAANKEITAKQADMARKYKELTGRNGTANNGPEQHDALTRAYRVHNDEEAGRILDALDRAVFHWQDLESKSRSSSVPNAPFKSDWHELAMKTMLRKAAEGGYDKIGWVTGEQTADRYDLSKHIDRLTYTPSDQQLVATKGEAGRGVFKQKVAPEQLSDYVGKDAAEKLLKAATKKDRDGIEYHEISGLDLKVGGEWAKNLYDRAIPNFLNKYGKKWGAKVGETTFPAETGEWEKKTETGWESTETPGPKNAPAQTVHSIPVTPEMRSSVLSEGQPLFSTASGPILPSIAAKIDFDIKPTTDKLPPYVRLNPEANEAISRALGVRIRGVNIDARVVPDIVTHLKEQADRMESRGARKGATNLRELANALLSNADPNFGVSIVRSGASEAEELATLHEEMIHGGQRAAGKGDLSKGVPWREVIGTPGMAQMASDRIVPQMMKHGLKPSADVIAAEGLVDIMRGDAWEISDQDAYDTARTYFEAMKAQHGIESVQRLQDIEDFVAQEAQKLGVNYGRQSVREAGRQALRSVLSGKTGERFQPLGERATPEQKEAAGNRTATSLSPGDTGEKLSRPGSSNEGGTLASTQPIGLTDEELAEWAKSKGFRTEPAGEQLDIFGANEPVLRVYRIGAKGKEQAGLIYQRQLDQLKEGKPEPIEPFALTGGESREEQPALFGGGDLGEIIGNPKAEAGIKLPSKTERGTSLFSTDSRERGSSSLAASPVGLAVDAATALKEYIRTERDLVAKSREIQKSFYDLEPKFGAAVLRAIPVMKGVEKSLGKEAKAIKEPVYHHLEDPENVVLNDKQNDLLDNVVLPIMEENNKLAEELRGEGFPEEQIANYVHRVVKGKGGWLDRIVQGAKRAGRLNPLSKSAPQLKGRTMMALEKKGDNLYPERMVVSLKGGQVTAWKDGQPSNLGAITNARDGRFWTDTHGNEWKLTQATTKEIEANTDLTYFHDPVASAIVSNLQLTRAVQASRAIDAIVKDPDFKTFGFKEEKGVNPPEGWQRSELGQVVPSLRDYYWEPHVREVLDWQAARMKQEGGLGLIDNVDRLFRLIMLVNPIAHPLNVMGSWAYEKGIQGALPWRAMKTVTTGIRALRDVVSKNESYAKALEAGGAMQSWRESLGDITNLFFKSLSDDIEAKDAGAIKIAKVLGFMDPHTGKLSVPVFQQLHSFSSKAAWISSDVFMLQSAYEKMERYPGMSLEDALTETARYIPDYRLPTRMFDNRGVASLLSNRHLTYFMAYHYGLLKSFGENAKSMTGLHEAAGSGSQEPPRGGGKGPSAPGTGESGRGRPASGPTRSQEAAEAWGRAAMLYLIPMVLMPLLFDRAAKMLTKDEKAKVRRPGPFGVVDTLAMVAAGQKTPVEGAMTVVSPNPFTEAGVELAFNRDLRSGRNIYDPSAGPKTVASQMGNFLLDAVPNVGELHQDLGDRKRLTNFLLRQAQVSFPKTPAEKAAAEIAAANAPTKAWTSEQRDSYYAKSRALEGLRNGDGGPLAEEMAAGNITPKQAKKIEHEARMTWLQEKVSHMSYGDALDVFDKANDEERVELSHILQTKRQNALKAGKGAEVEELEEEHAQ